jgi:hypothetical protein
MNRTVHYNEHVFRYYVAGLFDGEGSVDRWLITITNTNKHLLNICYQFLKTLKIKSKIYTRKSMPRQLQCFTLKIWGRDNLQKFYDNIPINHIVKRKKLFKNLTLYTRQKISKNIKQSIILDYRKGLTYRAIAKKYLINNHTTIWNFIKNIRKL